MKFEVVRQDAGLYFSLLMHDFFSAGIQIHICNKRKEFAVGKFS